MRIGVVFPNTEIGDDPDGIRTYVEVVEAAGATHLLTYEHVLGADTTNRPDWPGPYTHLHPFHEPFVLFGFLAGFSTLDLWTGVLVLPQRQTALVAKQAAEVDVLSGGRLTLGVGIGWNPVEYEALGTDFTTRGRRIEEQVEVLRRLWTEPVVDINGRDHVIPEAGILPMPVQRPIPIWFGTSDEPRALRRAGRLADGWIPLMPPGPVLDAAFVGLRAAAEGAGRDPDAIGLHGRVAVGDADLARATDHAGRWAAAGATHLSVNTLNAGLAGAEQHADAAVRALSALSASRT